MEAMSPSISVDLAEIYNTLVATQPTRPSLGHTRRNGLGIDDPLEVARQCEEIDELWNELGLCIHHWRNYPVEFIATRFCNLHYAKQPSVGNAYPLEPVWKYVVQKIEDQLYGKVVVMRFREHKPGRIYAWCP